MILVTGAAEARSQGRRAPRWTTSWPAAASTSPARGLTHAAGVATIGAVLGRRLRFTETHDMPGPFGAALLAR